MAKIQSKAKRVLAIVLSLMMVLGACFTGMVTASAETLATGLTAVATTATNGYSSSSGVSAFTDIEGGGITYSTTGTGAYRPYLHNQGIVGFPGGGVTLQFGNYVSTSAESGAGSRGYQSILIVLSKSANNGDDGRLRSAKVPAFILDTYNGNLDYVKGVANGQSEEILVQRVIENNDTIKYANITGKAFTITFAYNADGDIVATVDVEGTAASGVLLAENFASVVNAGYLNTFFSISSVDCNNPTKHAMSFDYYGYKTLGEFPAFANGLTDVASSSDMGGYALERTWGVWGDIPGSAFRYAMFQHAGLGPAGYKTDLYGYDSNWELQFANYVATADATYTVTTPAEEEGGEDTVETFENKGYGKFAINFSNTYNEFRIIPGSVFVAFDTIAGEVYLAKANDTVASNGDRRYDETYITKLADIASGEAFQLANFQGKPFALRLQQVDADNVKISVVIDGEAYGATIAKTLLAGGAYAMNASHGFASMQSLYSDAANQARHQCTLDFYGYRAIVSQAEEAARAEALAGITTTVTAADNTNGKTLADPNTKITDLANGGVHYVSNLAGYFVYQLGNVNFGAWPTSGFKLAFANFVDKSPTVDGHGQFFLMLSRRNGAGYSSSYDHPQKIGNMGIIVDTVNGDLVLAKTTAENTQTRTVLLSDDLFLYDNFKGKAFSFEFKLSGREAGEVQLDVAVGDEIRTVYLSMTQMTTFPEGHAGNNFCPTSACYVSFGLDRQVPNMTCSVDFLGYTKGVLPGYISDARENIDVLASLEATPDGRVHTATTETDIEGGGILIDGTFGYDAYNLAHNFGGWPRTGMKLQFANFVTTNTADDNAYKFALMLGNTASNAMQAWKGGNVMIVVNGQNGTVELAKCYGQQLQWAIIDTLVDDDAFLYNNFTGKAFSFEFQPSGKKANEVQVTIVVGDKEFVAYIDYNLMMAHESEEGLDYSDWFEAAPTQDWYYPTANNLYVGFGGMDNDSKGSFYFLGYTEGIAPAYMEEIQASVENTVTVDDNAYTSNTPNYISNIEGGGVHYNAIGHYPFQLGTGMDCWPGNGFKLQFANYAETSNATTAVGYGQFVVYFNYAIKNNTTYGPFWKGGNVGFNINTVEGQVELVKSDFATLYADKKYVQKVLVEDDMFLYENFSGSVFSYEILPAGFDNAARVIITVGDKAVSFVITYEELTLIPEGFGTNTYYPLTAWDGKTSNCNVSFSALLHDGTQAAVDFIGYTKYAAGNLTVGSTNALAYESASVPVSVTTETEQTMSIEVKADTAITGIVAAPDVEIESVIDGNTAIVNVLSAVAGADVKLFDVQLTTGDATIYVVEANVVEDAEGNKPAIRGAKGGVVVAENTPDITAVKKQATEGAYKLGTLGFGTDTTALMASVADNFIAIEFGTVFFTAKMLGEQDLVIGTKAVSGTASSITVSKKLASNEEVPAEFVAILKDKASNTGASVSDGYANTTFVARSFVKFMDADTGAILVVYGETVTAKLADMQ